MVICTAVNEDKEALAERPPPPQSIGGLGQVAEQQIR